jgi:hypothetical protein
MKFNRIIKPSKFDHFTIVPNAIFRHEGISQQATGLYCYLFSHKSDQQITINFITNHFKNGRDAIRSAIAELEQLGYLERKQLRQNGKITAYNYILKDTPATEKPPTEKPSTGKPSPENPIQSNTITSISNNNTNTNNNKYICTKSENVEKAYTHFVQLFPNRYRPKTPAAIEKWKVCLDRIERIDGYDLRKVYEVCKGLRQDQFWSENFLSVLKLRNSDKNGVRYIDRFMERNALRTRPTALNKLKGVKDLVAYMEGSTKMVKAITNNGVVQDLNLRMTLTPAEYKQIVEYAHSKY